MSQFIRDLIIAIRAAAPIIFVPTEEPDRIIQEIAQECINAKIIDNLDNIKTWTVSTGWNGDGRNDPGEVPGAINEFPDNTFCILQNFHWFLGENASPPLVQSFIDGYAIWKGSSHKRVIIVAPFYKIAPELERLVYVLARPLPSLEELRGVITDIMSDKDNVDAISPISEEEMEELVKAGAGLTRDEFETAFSISIIGNPEHRPLPESIMKTKTELITKSGYLEFWPSSDDLSAIGGLDSLKEWLGKREKGLTREAREFGLPYPKGILLLGVPGCGKSLSAKCIAKQWRLPLVRFDVGKVFASLVGESEQRMRTILRLIEALAPVVLWVDEIEKGLAGAKSVTSTDSGVTKRIFGTLISWMQDRPKDKLVYIIMTANDVLSLPPELLRKGRLDEIFWVDLPSWQERVEILRIHLTKRNQLSNSLSKEINDIAQLPSFDGFSGAEIENVIEDSMFNIFYDDRKVITRDDLETSIESVVPLSRNRAEEIELMRKWAGQRCKPAQRREIGDGAVIKTGRRKLNI